MERRRPTKEEILAAKDKLVPDVIRPGLKVLFCGINPGLYTAAIGYHFGRPGNRFWPALFLGGFTPRVFSPYDVDEFLSLDYGITNVVGRATATADELAPDELRTGRVPLVRKIKRYAPAWLAVVGVGAYRTAFNRPDAQVGEQPETIGTTGLWLLPNPSGLNAHYPLPKLGAAFADLKRALDRTPA